MSASSSACVTLLSSYFPRKCGIATFTHDLATALALEVYQQSLPESPVNVFVVNDLDDTYTYGPEVDLEIRQHRRVDYRHAADLLNTSKVDVVCLQHEYGLFGGEEGEYLLELINRLQKPLVSTLHTILTEPSPKKREVLQRICDRSSVVVVMAERAKSILHDRYDVPLDRIELIHHGVPDLPFADTAEFKTRFGVAGRPTILTFGLLSPSKNIEVMIEAIAKVVPEHPNLVYIVLGVTHPGVRRASGESYRLSLEHQVRKLGIQHNVLFHDRYVSLPDLCDYLQATDIYVTPYQGKEQITSGTLAYALASGRAIVSTPYWHAQELLAGGRGRLVEFGDVDGFADAIGKFLDDPAEREATRRAAYDFGRAMIWPTVAAQYARAFARAKVVHSDRTRAAATAPMAPVQMSLPDVRLDHLFTMTDDTGMLQHALCATPARAHGYCTDDNARALVLTTTIWTLFRDERVLPYLQTYLSFLNYARREPGALFHNFMSYDRRWLPEDPSEDCHGRVVWALGHLVAHAPTQNMRSVATDLFREALTPVASLRYPRAWALSVLGLDYYLRHFGDDDEVRMLLRRVAKRLNRVFADNETPDWPWFEDTITYDNGRLPQAMIIAGIALDDSELLERGLRVLRWLLNEQTAGLGHVSLIGNKGWYRRGQERASFDQQPLEAAALVGACRSAHRATGDKQWVTEMRRCFEWFLGQNDIGLSLVDFSTRGCYDGLKPDSVNENQGAESLLSWLLSLVIMHQMQTGDTLAVG